MKTRVATLKQKVRIPASPEDVYEAFMDPKKHTAFTRSKATNNPKVGGHFTAWDGYISGKNIELEKGKRIVQEWITTEWPQGYTSSSLELTFIEAKGSTEISIVQSNVPVEQVEDLKEGWREFYWKPLKEYFKKEKGQEPLPKQKRREIRT